MSPRLCRLAAAPAAALMLLLVAVVPLLHAQPADDGSQDPQAGEPDREDEGRPFPTFLVLGYGSAVDSVEGPPTPVWVVDHLSRGYPGAGVFTFELATTVLDAAMRHALHPVWQPGYAVRGEAYSAGNGQDVYRRGERLRRATFEGHNLGGAATLHLAPERPWRARLDYEQRQYWYHPAGDTAKQGFEPPPDHGRQRVLVEAGRHGLPGGGRVRLRWEGAQRHGYEAWALDPVTADAEAHEAWQRTTAELEQSVPWTPRHGTTLELTALRSQDVDFLSATKAGSLLADVLPVAGHYRHEYRARDALHAELRHEWSPAEDRRFSLIGHWARLRRIDAPYLAGTPERRTVSGVAVGMHWGIRTLGGLPIIARYGQGFGYSQASPEPYRQEVLLLLAAAF